MQDSFEIALPTYLKNDIFALQEGRKNSSTLLDCLYCEVQGSINSALYSNEITKNEATFLREKYLGISEG